MKTSDCEKKESANTRRGSIIITRGHPKFERMVDDAIRFLRRANFEIDENTFRKSVKSFELPPGNTTMWEITLEQDAAL